MEKSNLMMIVIIVLLLALLGTIVGVTFYAFRMVQNMEQAAQDWDRTQRDLRPDEINHVHIGAAIVTNLSTDTPGGVANSMARVQLVVGYDNTQGRESSDISQVINEQMTLIRMMALDALGSSTYGELTSQDGRSALSRRLLLDLQNEFMTNMIVTVGFYEWMITR